MFCNVRCLLSMKVTRPFAIAELFENMICKASNKKADLHVNFIAIYYLRHDYIEVILVLGVGKTK